MHLGHKETLENDFVEVGVCAADQEAVELKYWVVMSLVFLNGMNLLFGKIV